MAGYATPAWTNNSTPAIDAASLTAIGQGIELGEHPYGVCSTAASTAAKTVTIDFSGTLTLFTGMSVRVKFSNANTAASPTLNVNSTGAKPILFGTGYRGSWIAGAVAVLTYDGTNWVMSMPFGIDATPTDGSANLVSSTGINAALSDLKSTTCNPNLLDNWFFAGGGSRFPVNTRGQSIYSGGPSFTIDRWFLRNSDGAGSPSVAVQNDGVLVTLNAHTAVNLQAFMQNVKDFRNLAGKTVTLSALIDSNTLSGGGTCILGLWNSTNYGANNTTISGSTISVVGVTGLVTKTCTLPDPFTRPDGVLNMGVFTSEGENSTGVDGTIKFVAMKMELGDQQTLAHLENGVWVLNEIPDYATEEVNSLTANPNTTADANTNFYPMVANLTSSGNPYFRFYTGNGEAYQFVVTASKALSVQKLANGTWTTISTYNADS